jgi:hypothetical protein
MTAVRTVIRRLVAGATASLVVAWPSAVDDPSLLDWAVSRYELAGVEVPPVELVVGGDWCAGIVSAYVTDGGIVVCQPGSPRLPTVLLHEIGHLLDHAYLTDADRAALMEAWGTSTWDSREVTWSARGAEQFADAVAWVVGVEDSRLRTGRPEAEWEIVRVGLNAQEMYLAFEVLLAAADLVGERDAA